jgi:NhaA family Na+:H+ antiporter
MKPAAISPTIIPAPRAGGATLKRAVQFVFDRFLLLPLGALIALVWANSASESYFSLAHALSFTVNEIGMALVIGLLTQEAVEAMMPGGTLHSWRRWSLPIAGAVGGIVVAALVFLGYVNLHHEIVLADAWPIVTVIDVAAAYYVVKILCPRSAVIPFVLLLGIATQVFGLVVVALSPGGLEPRADGAILMALAIGSAMVLRARQVRGFWPYLLVSGTLSWFAFYREGVHPALALLPVIPFLPREPRATNPFADPVDNDEVHHFEHEWNEAAQLILFLFGLVNAGVILKAYDTGTWAILLASLIGRPLGILVGVGLGVALGLHLPRRVGIRELIVIALATSSGFTFALFLATGLLPLGAVLTQIKVGVLATVLGAPMAAAAAYILGVRRMKKRVR